MSSKNAGSDAVIADQLAYIRDGLMNDGECWSLVDELPVSAAEWRLLVRRVAHELGWPVRTVLGVGQVRAWIPSHPVAVAHQRWRSWILWEPDRRDAPWPGRKPPRQAQA